MRERATASFALAQAQVVNANPRFRPRAMTPADVAALALAATAPATRVSIVTSKGVGVDLVATVSAKATGAAGVRRVAGLQTVSSTVLLDFTEALPLFWMASVFQKGQVAANDAFQAYGGANDAFALAPVPGLTLSYASGSWTIPAFDSTQVEVNVGLGLAVGANYYCWAYSAACSPQTHVAMQFGGYNLVRSDGREQIGDPVTPNAGDWMMPLGADYTLAFDGSGNGVLSP